MFPRFLTLLSLFSMLAGSLCAQGLETNATAEDWEEINFEFNSSVLVDGYPSLLRLADLLKNNPGWRIRVVGHADHIGGNNYNEKLGLARANTVKNFLVKYGATSEQVEVGTQGETAPKTEPKRRGYSRTDEGRWINRRVTFTVTNAEGQAVNALVGLGPQVGISDILKRLDKLDEIAAAQEKCCDAILKRLDRLDEIAAMLQKLTGLESRIQALEKQNQALMDAVGQRPTAAQVTDITTKTTTEALERERIPRYNILNANVGADSNGNLTVTGRGRYFVPFRERFAIQAQGEYMYFRDRQEGQFDIGLVNRFSTRVQAGLFSSFKHVNFSGEDPGRNIFTDRPATQFDPGEMRGNGTLGQASMTLDYLFSRGRVGIFGTKGFMDEATINRVALSRNVFNEYYLRTIDQYGASATIGLMGDVYAEGNLGYLKSRGNADRPGGTLRFVFPLSERLAFTLEGGVNETLLGRDNNGRVVAGLQFGNFMRPKDYLAGFGGVEHAVPTDIPRVRYEILTRRVRTGNDAPIADAGPDQIGVAAGEITLDGSSSYDPDGDPITFQWAQVAGPGVSLTGANMAQASFTAAEGQTYSFRLTVKDDKNAQSIARVTVTTEEPRQVRILRFQATPNVLDAGQSATLTWQVENAESVEISGVGPVNATSGATQVNPQQTTTYTLIARNPNGEVRETTTVTVRTEEVRFLSCTAEPMNIMAGETATLFWAADGADDVSISGIGSVGVSGTRTVTPQETTTYTLTARSNGGGQATCTINVQVTPGQMPRIIGFTANPTQIASGQASTLMWEVENATEVTISSVGTVQQTGAQEVRPTQTTTYTLTARNQFGEISATATVSVTADPAAPTLTACSASPTVSPRPTDPVQLLYTTTNATSVTITGVPSAGLQGPVMVNPITNTVYTITATSAGGQTATCQISVTVTPSQPPTPVITGPSVVDTFQRQLTLDASQSVDPQGLPLTYLWEPLSTGAAVLDQGQVQTRVQIGGLAADYVFRLTVTNAAGQSASTTVTVRFRRTTFP